jgi:hypothetical protein
VLLASQITTQIIIYPRLHALLKKGKTQQRAKIVANHRKMLLHQLKSRQRAPKDKLLYKRQMQKIKKLEARK